MTTTTTTPSDRLLSDVRQLLDAGQIAEALNRIERSALKNPPAINARAVCLLRAGRHQQAMDLLRGLVFHNGVGQFVRDTPTIYLANYVTALLLEGNVTIAWGLLGEIADRQHPSIVRLNEALAHWRKSLPRFRSLLAALGFYPADPVPLDFPPGEV